MKHNHELHKCARRIVAGEKGREFVQELLTKYSKVPFNKKNYTQDWSSYNAAQQKEKIILMNILDELLDYIPIPDKKSLGRKQVSFRDKVFSIVLQAYNIKSSRRCIADLELARRTGYMSKTLHFNTVLRILKDLSITPYLKHLILVSGIPLQGIESDFAVDASGFSTSEFGRWLDVRTGSQEQKRKYVKIHLTCGTKTNIITSVNITKSKIADTVEFSSLIKDTNKVFEMKEVSADKAYSSKKNLDITYELGAIPFIPFKKNTSPKTGIRKGYIWKKMYRFFLDYPDEYRYHYHKRSNVETVFHMLKKKFGKNLRSKSFEGQTNEVLAKCLCHNLCVLIQESLEIGIELDFEKCMEIPIIH